jgi:hemerythrin superfamily protein
MNPVHEEGARATDFLRVDHAWVQQLFNEYRASMQADLPRATVAAEICRNVEAHCEAESTMLYPMVRHEAESVVRRLIQEREAILATVAEVRAFAYDPPARDVLMAQLMALVERHSQAEEQELFPLIEERMPATVRRLHPGVVQARHAAHIDGPAARIAVAA